MGTNRVFFFPSQILRALEIPDSGTSLQIHFLLFKQISVGREPRNPVSWILTVILATAFCSLLAGAHPAITAGAHRVALSRSVREAFQCLHRWGFCCHLLFPHFLHFSSQALHCSKENHSFWVHVQEFTGRMDSVSVAPGDYHTLG